MAGGILPIIAAGLALQAAPAALSPGPDSPPQAQVANGVVELDEVAVTGQRLDEVIRTFVDEVAKARAQLGQAVPRELSRAGSAGAMVGDKPAGRSEDGGCRCPHSGGGTG